MVHVPVRGLFTLVRAAKVIAIGAAVPFVLKRSKPLAKAVGQELVKLGEWLKEEGAPSEASAQTQATPADTPQPEPKPKAESKPKAAGKAAKSGPKPKTEPKASSSARKRSPRSKPAE